MRADRLAGGAGGHGQCGGISAVLGQSRPGGCGLDICWPGGGITTAGQADSAGNTSFDAGRCCVYRRRHRPAVSVLSAVRPARTHVLIAGGGGSRIGGSILHRCTASRPHCGLADVRPWGAVPCPGDAHSLSGLWIHRCWVDRHCCAFSCGGFGGACPGFGPGDPRAHDGGAEPCLFCANDPPAFPYSAPRKPSLCVYRGDEHLRRVGYHASAGTGHRFCRCGTASPADKHFPTPGRNGNRSGAFGIGFVGASADGSHGFGHGRSAH